AWRAVQTLSLAGKLGAGGNRRAAVQVPVPDQKANRQSLPSRPTEEAQLPFVMELKRPRKMRFELQFNGQTAVQVFDGANGWKRRLKGSRECSTASTIQWKSTIGIIGR